MVGPGVVDKLGWYYAPAIFVLYLLAIIVIFAYRISQEVHEDNLRSLAAEAGIAVPSDRMPAHDDRFLQLQSGAGTTRRALGHAAWPTARFRAAASRSGGCR